MNYDRYTSYTENLNDDNGADNGGYTLDNYYRLEGTGMGLKLGVIIRPIESSPSVWDLLCTRLHGMI